MNWIRKKILKFSGPPSSIPSQGDRPLRPASFVNYETPQSRDPRLLSRRASTLSLPILPTTHQQAQQETVDGRDTIPPVSVVVHDPPPASSPLHTPLDIPQTANLLTPPTSPPQNTPQRADSQMYDVARLPPAQASPMPAPVVNEPPSNSSIGNMSSKGTRKTIKSWISPSSSFRDSSNIPRSGHSRSRTPSFVFSPPENETYALSSLSTQCALTLSEVTKEIAPIPAIGQLVDCLKRVFQAVERSRVNKEQWELLRGRCVMVLRIAGAHVENHGKEHYPRLDEAVALLQDTLNRIEERARYYTEMNQMFALVLFQSISDEIRTLFTDLDACLRLFNFTVEVAQEQWMGEYQAVQRREFSEIQRLRGELEKMNINFDAFGKNQEELLAKTKKMVDAMQQVLNDSTISQDQATRTVASYADTQQLIHTILSATGIQLPPRLLVGKQLILDASTPIKTGITCDIYQASFLGGEKVAKKVFRLGTFEKGNVEKYSKRFLDNASLWDGFQSKYTLPFYGVGMESLGEDNRFQLYMVSPLMKNFDAITYLNKNRDNPGMRAAILRIITDAARGLQALHHRSTPVVHSGVRGDNVLITDSGGGVLGGFGLTKTAEKIGRDDVPSTVIANKTDSQRWMVRLLNQVTNAFHNDKVALQAPEIFANNSLPPQPPSDVWGWAMASLEERCFTYIVSGSPPYHKHKQASTVSNKINEGPPKRKDHIKFQHYAYRPDEMWELLERCWARMPENRPTIDSVVGRLEEIVRMQEYGLQSLPDQAPTPIDSNADAQQLVQTMDKMSVALRQILNDRSMLLQDQTTTTMDDYVDAQQIVRTILSITNLQLPPRLLLGRQCIVDTPTPINSGIACNVYQASFLGGEKVAKKLFRIGVLEMEFLESYAREFLRMAGLWSDLRSEYTLQFYGIGMEPFEGDSDCFQLYTVSPLMKNSDAASMTFLKQYRGQQGMKKNILRIITDAAMGLQYLHNRQPPVVHSNMRGGNILITDSEGGILGGFRLAKALESVENPGLPPAIMTEKLDSQRWLAPEMLDDDPVLETPCDIWGWAMTALEIVSGSIPYHNHKQPMTVMIEIRRGPPRREHYPTFEVYGYRPDEMWDLLQECWASEPDDRPTIDEVVTRLKQIAKMPEAGK